jgi:hypothetical protein
MKKGLSETAPPYKGRISPHPGRRGGDTPRAANRNAHVADARIAAAHSRGLLDPRELSCLTREDLAAAWAYYEANRAEVDAALAEQNAEDDWSGGFRLDER